MVSIRPIQPDQWRTYRDVRLRALQDAPDAFGSTLAAEAGRTDDLWAARVAAAASSARDRAFFAWHDTGDPGDPRACGLAWCKACDAPPDMADLFQMWVAPEVRGQGVGTALLQAVVAHARRAGLRTLRLGVTVADSPAMRLYRGFGFVPVGGAEPLREGSPLRAQTMHLDLPAPAPRAG